MPMPLSLLDFGAHGRQRARAAAPGMCRAGDVAYGSKAINVQLRPFVGVTEATEAMNVRLRPFTDADQERRVEIGSALYPDSPRSIQMVRHGDSIWDSARYFRLRLAATRVTGAGGEDVVAWGELEHMPWQFHPDKYGMGIEVHPAYQRQGIGNMLYERLLAEAHRRKALLVRSGAKESKKESLRFLAKRGFTEVQRTWESRLNVATFDWERFAGAQTRAAEQGIMLTTLAAEGARDLSVLHQVHDLAVECTADEPALDPVTPAPFEDFIKDEIEAPNALPAAYFLAKDGDRYVGLSALFTRLAQPGVLSQGFTCVQRDYRGRGIAMALKMRGLVYARDHGIREIRTFNNTRNQPMLRINEAMGFTKEPAWVEYALPLRPQPVAPPPHACG